MELATLTVNGQNIQAPAGSILLQVLIDNGISVPHFCYHEALGVDGNCRMCMVEIEGEKRPQISCNTPVKDGMAVNTLSDSIMAVKRNILELELINHPIDCPICDQAGECSLQNYYMDVGLNASRIDPQSKVHKAKKVDLGSNVVLDQERCVLCARCTRFTENIIGTGDLVISNRGNHACVTTFEPQGLKANGYAMNVVDLCPVGALTSKDFRFHQRVWFLTSDPSICHGCARGCSIYIDHNAPKYGDDLIYRYRPRVNRDVNGFFICDTGRLSYKELTGNATLKTPRHHKMDIPLSVAFTQIKEKLSSHTGRIIALISPSLSCENMIAAQRYCALHSIPLFGVEEASIDSEFGDDFLRLNDRAANRSALNLIGISEDKKAMENALSTASLVINFDNLTPCSIEQIHFTVRPYASDALQIPIAPYTEQSGTVINALGKIQCFASTIKRKESVFPLHDLLLRLDENLDLHDLKESVAHLGDPL